MLPDGLGVPTADALLGHAHRASKSICSSCPSLLSLRLILSGTRAEKSSRPDKFIWRSSDEPLIVVPGALGESGFGGAEGVKAGSMGRDVIGDLTTLILGGEERLE